MIFVVSSRPGNRTSVAVPAQRWLRVGDVAMLLDVSPNTVRRWTDDGKVRSYRSPGGHRRYREHEIHALLAAQPQWRRETGGDTATPQAAITRLAELVDIGATFSRAGDVNAALHAVVQRLLTATSSTFCTIYRRRGDGLYLATSVGAAGDCSAEQGKALDSRCRLLEHAARHDEVLVIDHRDDPRLTAEECAWLAEWGAQSELAVPLHSGGELVGLIVILSAEEREYSSSVDFVTSIGQAVAGALRNDSLLDEVEQRNVALHEMVELGSIAAQTNDLDEFLRILASRVRTAVGAVDVDIWRLHGEEMRCLVSIDENGSDAAAAGRRLDLSLYPSMLAAYERADVAVLPDLSDPSLSEPERVAYENYGYLSNLSAPIVTGGHVVGIIDVYDRVRRDFAEHLDFIKSLTQMVAGFFENAVLLREVEERNAALRDLVELGELLAQTHEIDELVSAVARRLITALRATSCEFWRYTDGGLGRLTLVDESGERPDLKGLPLDLSHYPSTAAAIESGTPLLIDDLGDPRLTPLEVADYESRQLSSSASMPLVVEDRVIGWFDVYDRSPRQWEDELDFLRSVAQLVAGSLEKATLLAKVERRNVALRELVELGDAVAQTLDVEHLVRVAADRLVTVLECAACDIWRVQGGHMQCLVSLDTNGYDDGEVGKVVELADYPATAAAVANNELFVFETLDDPRLSPGEVEKYSRWGFRSGLSLPLIVEGRVVGLIDIYDVRERDFNERLDFARNVGQTLSGAFEKAVLLDELEQRYAAQRELLDIGEVLAQTTDLETMLSFVGRRLLAITQAASCDIYRVEGDLLHCLVSVTRDGLDDAFTGRLLELDENPLARMQLASPDPVVVASLDDPRLTPAELEMYRRWGSRSSLSFPLIVGGRALGLIDIDDARERDYAEHLDFARNVGQLLAGAFEKAFLLDRLEEGNHELRGLVDAGLELGASLDVNVVLASAALRMRDATDASYCDIYAIDGEFLVSLVTVGEDGVDEDFAGTTFRLEDYCLCLEAIDTRSPVASADVVDDPRVTDVQRRDFAALGLRSCLVLPLENRGDVIGVATVFSPEVREFGHIELLQGLAQIAAQAIGKASLYRELDETANRMALISESSLEFSSSLDMDDVMQAAAHRLCASVDTPDCMISVLRGDTVQCLVNMVDGAVDAEQTGSELALDGRSAVELVRESRRPLTFASLDDPRLTPESREVYQSQGRKSGILLPLLSGHVVSGIVELLETRYERVFSEAEIATAEAICRVAALAIDNAGLFENVKLVNREITLLNEIAQRTAASLDVSEVATAAVAELRHLVPFDHATLVLDDAGFLHVPYTDDPYAHKLSGRPMTSLDAGVLKRLLKEDVVYLGLDEGAPFGEGTVSPDLRAAAIIALSNDGGLIGALGLGSTHADFFARVDRRLLVRVGTHLSLAIKNARLYEDIKQMHVSNLKALSSALNAKDYYTLGHAARVSAYMLMMGRELGWSEEYTRQAEEAAYLHDIGKIGISDRVLLKAGKLNAQEWELMRQHPVFSADIIRTLFDEEFVTGVRHHHERYDGDGYPDGLAGDDIPPIARAMCLVDSYDAMSFQRPYHAALTYEECLAELESCRGRQFDPAMTDAFLKVLKKLAARRRKAVAVAEQAAARIDPARHAVLRSAEDAARPEYAYVVSELRALRDANPPARFVTTYTKVNDRLIVVGDSEEPGPDRSELGDELVTDISIELALRDQKPTGNTLAADQFGVWVTGLASMRDASGDIIAAVTADLPPTDTAPGARGGRTQTLASMLQTAAVRLSRAEIDAITDGLTGLYNHRYLHERLAEEIARAREQKTQLALLFADLDHFKEFNDRFGHSAGDRALRGVAHVFDQTVRRIDLAARYGGEEFVVVGIDTDVSGARELAERIRKAIRESVFVPGQEPLTISIGIATFPADGDSKEDLLDKADWAMYLAKRRGRDRIELFNPAETTADENAALAHRQRHTPESSTS